MRKSFLNNVAVLMVVVLTGCSNEKIETAISELTKPKFDTLTIGKKVYMMENIRNSDFTFKKFEFEGESDSMQIEKFKNNVSRQKDTLFLICDNGKIVKLVNNLNEEDYIGYDFRYVDTDINAFVISCSFYEAGSVLLINKTTGDSLETIGLPVVSPDKKKFVCYNLDLEAAFTPNGLELFDYNAAKYILKGLRELNDWGPQQITWKNDTTLIVKAMQRGKEPGAYKIAYKAVYIK